MRLAHKSDQLSLNSPNPHDTDPCESLSKTMNDFTRHSQLWFDDGNIVLDAQDIGFRIYRGLLAAQSTVFADMFSASSSIFDQAFNGCPIVYLTDSQHDLTHLLRVLLPTSSIRYLATDPELNRSFDEISSVIRLAHKYHVQSIQDQAVRALQEHWFSSDFCAPGIPPTPRISFTREQCIGVVNLARLTNTSLMLPAALYACCYLRGALLDGWTCEDGTVEHLCAGDLKRCLNASIALGHEQLLIIFRVFGPVPRTQCKNNGHCTGYLSIIADRVVRGVEYLTTMGPLGDWSPWIQRREHLCGECMGALLERTRVECRRVWNALPQIFGITVEGGAKPDGAGAAGAQA